MSDNAPHQRGSASTAAPSSPDATAEIGAGCRPALGRCRDQHQGCRGSGRSQLKMDPVGSTGQARAGIRWIRRRRWPRPRPRPTGSGRHRRADTMMPARDLIDRTAELRQFLGQAQVSRRDPGASAVSLPPGSSARKTWASTKRRSSTPRRRHRPSPRTIRRPVRPAAQHQGRAGERANGIRLAADRSASG